ncbi:MAG: signal peptidase II [Gemmatimonadaceae bacterium]|nr:signal peptidase II [Gemmatimonadaceae bacterium]
MRNSASTDNTIAFWRDPVTRRFSMVAAAALLIDLATKESAVRLLGTDGYVSLTDRLSLFLVWNTGVTGGVSVGPFTAQLNVIVTVLALWLVITVVRPMASVDPRAASALGLVTGGALGNLASILVGPPGVADFIGIRLSADATMVANVADFALWGGALMLAPVALTLVKLVRDERAERVAQRAATSA